jgi:mRNA-degrading endonuclease toxin of MazEF toxin-antitoxin module
MPFEFGDVVLVPFLFTSQRASKKRPAVVVSNPGYGATRPDVIVMAVTSQLRPDSRSGDVLTGDVLIRGDSTKSAHCHCEERLARRSNLDRSSPSAARDCFAPFAMTIW